MKFTNGESLDKKVIRLKNELNLWRAISFILLIFCSISTCIMVINTVSDSPHNEPVLQSESDAPINLHIESSGGIDDLTSIESPPVVELLSPVEFQAGMCPLCGVEDYLLLFSRLHVTCEGCSEYYSFEVEAPPVPETYRITHYGPPTFPETNLVCRGQSVLGWLEYAYEMGYSGICAVSPDTPWYDDAKHANPPVVLDISGHGQYVVVDRTHPRMQRIIDIYEPDQNGQSMYAHNETVTEVE